MRLLFVLTLAGCLDSASDAPDGGVPVDLSVGALSDGAMMMANGDGPLPAPPDLSISGTLYVYVSGYATQIARFVLDPQSGALSSAGTTTVTGSPSFLAVDPARRHLYAVDEATAGQVEAFSIDSSNGALTHLGDVSSGGNGPAHLSVDPGGKWVLVANYGDGTVSVLPIGAGGALGTASDTRSAGRNAHQILADATSAWVFVPCLGADYVAQYALDATGKLAPNTVPTAPTATGAGPRHLAFHPGAPFVYLIDETASTIGAWSYDATTGRLASLQAPLSTRAAGATGTNTGAEVVVHPTGKWLYGSNRGDDTIAIFSLGSDGKMTALGRQPTGGQTPRSFTINPSGRWLLVAGQASNDVRVFAVDASSGGLTATGSPVTAPSPSFVGVVVLP